MLGFALTLAAITIASDSDSTAQRSGGATIPAIYHGKWSPDLAECRNLDGPYRDIGPRSFSAFHMEGRPLRVSAIRNHRTPSGQAARTVIIRMAWELEGEPATGNLRLSRVGNRVMTSDADETSEAEHFAEPLLRCPARSRR
jgi:hypothetical protein